MVNAPPKARRVKRCWVLVRRSRRDLKGAETLKLTIRGVGYTPVFTTHAKCLEFARAATLHGHDVSSFDIFETAGLVCIPMVNPDPAEVMARSR